MLKGIGLLIGMILDRVFWTVATLMASVICVISPMHGLEFLGRLIMEGMANFDLRKKENEENN